MSRRPSARRRRRRIPRRRFHALRLDTAILLFFVAALAAAFPSAAAFRASRHGPAPAPFALGLAVAPVGAGEGAPEPAPLFSPTVFAFGRGGFLPEAPEAPEAAAEVAARRPIEPPAAPRAADAALAAVPLPESALATRLAPADPLFSEPRRPRSPPAAAGRAAPRSRGEMALFYPAGGTLPTVVVDAPSLPPSAIPAFEAEAFAMRVSAAPTSRVVRVDLGAPGPR